MRVWIGTSVGASPSPGSGRPWRSTVTISAALTALRPACRALINTRSVPGRRALMCPWKSINPSPTRRRMAEARRDFRAPASDTLAAAPRQHLRPAAQERLPLDDLLRAEELLEPYPLDRVHRALEILVVPKWDGGVDPHAALEAGVHRRPLPVPRREALLGDEGLPRAAGNRIEDVRPRVHAGGQTPDDLVHVVDIDVIIDDDREAHPLTARHGRDEEVADHAVIGLEPLLDLDDAAAPIGHLVGDVHVLDDAGLEPFAEFEDRRLAHGGIDIVTVEHVDAEQVEDRLGGAAAHRNAGDVKRRRAVRLAHVAGPFRMEREPSLLIGRLGLRRFVALVARMEVAFQHQFAVGHRPGVDRPSLDDPDGEPLHRA